jgi:hypothetical protein
MSGATEVEAEADKPNPAEVFKICTNGSGDLILLHKPDHRQFHVHLPVSKQHRYQFVTHGFRSLHAREIIMEAVRTFNFEYSLHPTHLTLEFAVENTKGQSCTEMFRCEETFDMPVTPVNIDGVVASPAEAKRLITVLYNKIRNLEGKLAALGEQLEWQEDLRRMEIVNRY